MMQAASRRYATHLGLQLCLQATNFHLACLSFSTVPLQVTPLLTTRGVIRVTGASVIHFLQGLVTNDVRALEKPAAAPLYAAFLTPKGKFIHDAFLHHAEDSTPTVHLDVDCATKEALVSLLKRYRLRQKIDIQDVSADYCIWTQFGTSQPQAGGAWPLDPRLPELGLRAILPRDTDAAAAGGKLATEADYLQWRVLQGVAEGSKEIPADKAHPLEYNLDGLNGLSYTKGCYVGQEKQSFTHFRGVIRRRLMPAHIEQADGGPISIGEQVVTESGEEVGSVRAVADGAVLAHLRLQQALAVSQHQTVLRLRGRGVCLVPWVPSWWPRDWTAPAEETPQ